MVQRDEDSVRKVMVCSSIIEIVIALWSRFNK